MKLRDGALTLSPSDLNDFLACEHLAHVSHDVAVGKRQPPPPAPSATADAIRKRGYEHERAQLEAFEHEALRVFHVPRAAPDGGGLDDAAARTGEALRHGFDVLYQATFFDGRWQGRPDFVVRVPPDRRRAEVDYEIADAKLARYAKPSALLQLSAYSDQLARVQGRAPLKMHLLLGDGTRASFVVADFAAYFRAARNRFEAWLRVAASSEAYPEPVEHCAICNWSGACDARREMDDHLSLVYSIRRDQRRKLTLVGIETMTALAAAGPGALPPTINEATRARLRRQAQMQVAQRASGAVTVR